MMRHLLLGLLTATTACTGSIDGGGGDDDPPPPPTDDVSIRVRDGATPIAGVTVIFQAADETVIAELVTDATGTAIAPMPNGGNLTVIRRYPLPTVPEEDPRPTEVFTYVGVAGGDVLELGAKMDTLGTPSAINVQVPPEAPGTINVVTPCGSGQGQAPLIPVTVRGCGSNFGVYVMDGDGSAFVKMMPYSSLIDVSLEGLLQSTQSTLSASNILPPITAVSVEKRLEMAGYQVFSTGNKRVEAGGQQVNLPNLTGIDELLVTAITDGNNRTQMFADRKAYIRGTTIVDIGAAGTLPYVTNPVYSPTGLSWVEEPGTVAPNMVLATLTVARDIGQALPGQDDVYLRAIVSAHGAPTLRMPLLPLAHAKFNPGATDQIGGELGLIKFDGDYAAARASVFTASSILEVAPMNGRVQMSYAGNTPPSI